MNAKPNGFKTIYTFQGGKDGANPNAALRFSSGVFFGTTLKGGVGPCYGGCGTVFSITESGQESVLHHFGNDPDAASPYAPLIEFNGKLYGTSSVGGNGYCQYYQNGCGSVYEISTTGEEKVVSSFSGPGANPVAALTQLDGVLYGVTQAGGDGDCLQGCGLVFQEKGGIVTAIYSFTNRAIDGVVPKASMIAVHGALYGTTSEGGTAPSDVGTVFKVTPSGQESVIHSFTGSPDGAVPEAGLIDVGGNFYGTTASGGTGSCSRGCGTIFSITESGNESVLYSFKGGNDGAKPLASLIDVDGALYGTTSSGGSTNAGTVFKVTLTGVETTLHAFARQPEGATPNAALVDVDGELYGTTSAGGVKARGTVFEIAP